MGVKEIQQHIADWLNSSGNNPVLSLEQLAEKIGLIHDGKEWRRNVKKRDGDTYILKMPEEDEFIKYWIFYGYDPIIAKDAYWRYRNKGWKDRNNKLIKNWKTKSQQVWFRPENKLVKIADKSKFAINLQSNLAVKEHFNQKYK